MIKLPIRLETETDWKKVVGGALDCREALQKVADAEEADTGEYIRPIILFQAQSRSSTKPHRLTPEVVVKHLVEEKGIKREQIAIHATGFKELDDVDDIEAKDCPIRYVVTVQKLREGWDCPFAYVLCSVAEQVSQTAIEQILGRVLRMPKANRKQRDALNRAYAFVAAQSFDDAAQKLKDGLVEGAGFNRIEAEQLITSQGDIGFAEESDDYEFESDPIDDDAETIEAVAQAIDNLPAANKARVVLNRQSGSLKFKGPMSKDSRNTLQLALAKIPQAEKVVERLHAKTNNIPLQASSEEEKPAFIVPLMGFKKQGDLELFSKEHFLDLPWRLDACDVSSIVERFKLRDESEEGEIDVTEKGKVEIGFVGRMQEELAAVIQEPAWTLPRLVNWIDSGIKHTDVTKPSAVVFISNALRALEGEGLSLDVLARNK
jgi:type III restriction enzyme